MKPILCVCVCVLHFQDSAVSFARTHSMVHLKRVEKLLPVVYSVTSLFLGRSCNDDVVFGVGARDRIAIYHAMYHAKYQMILKNIFCAPVFFFHCCKKKTRYLDRSEVVFLLQDVAQHVPFAGGAAVHLRHLPDRLHLR